MVTSFLLLVSQSVVLAHKVRPEWIPPSRGVTISDLLRRYIHILPLKPGDDVPVALSWDASEHEFYKVYGIGNFHEGRDFHRWMT